MRSAIMSLPFALCLLHPRGLAAAESYGFSRDCTATAQAGPVRVKLCDLYFEKKAHGIFLMWDATTYQSSLPGPGDLTRSAVALLQGPGRKDYPGARNFEMAVVQVTERDNYGMPRWDTIKILLRLTCVVNKHGRVVAAPR